MVRNMQRSKFWLAGVLMLWSTLNASAQFEPGEGYGKISGTVVDATSKEPVEYATIAVVDPKSGKPVSGGVCDGKGKFSINHIPFGPYNVVVSFIGFEPKSVPATLSTRHTAIELGTIQLAVKTEMLDEVTVTAKKSLIEERVDRTIYNAENDVTTRGGDATDLLKRVPMLSVDLDGNLSLRGNSNVKVLVNNKPSAIMASNLADALKQIPAEDIKSVEVITSPSAKYDAEGSAGIINIITKKNVLDGIMLNINSSAGLRGSNLGLNGAYKRGKLGLNLGGWGRGGYNTPGHYTNTQTTYSSDTTTIKQDADTRKNDLFGRYKLGMEYDFDKNNFITSSVKYGVRNKHSYQDDLRTTTLINDGVDSETLRDVNVTDESGTIDLNLGYTHLFEKPQKEFSVLGMYSRNDRTNDFVRTTYDDTETTVSTRRKNLNNSYNQEVTARADFQTPFKKDQLLEVGAKTIMREVSSNYKYFDAEGAHGTYAIDTESSNVFHYDQNIMAAYLSYTLSFLTDYSLKAGTRYEYTTIDASFQNDTDVDIPDYGVWAPSVNISRKLANGNMVKAAFNRRIQRPSINYLNPNTQSSNPYKVSVGNPDLGPEYTNNYELSYNHYIKGVSLNFSSFMRNTNNAIQSISEASTDSTIVTTYQNIGNENAYGLSVFANLTIGKFSLNGGTDIYYATLSNNSPDPNYDAHNEGWVASYRMSGGYDLNNGWAFQFFGFYRGRRVQLQGYQTGFGVYSLNLKKDFADKKGSVGIGAENFLTNGFTQRSTLHSYSVDQQGANVIYNMNFKVNFSYRIGKLKNDANSEKRSRRSINNDDLKEEGGDMGGGSSDTSFSGQGGRRSQNTQKGKSSEKNAAAKEDKANTKDKKNKKNTEKEEDEKTEE